MRYDMSTQTEKYAKAHLRKKRWHRLLTALSCIVVFCTVYALIIPAITLSEDPICGLEEHIHTEECYSQVTVPTKINCTFNVHKHDESCKKDGEFVCGFADYVIHEHDKNCYDENDKLICELPEIKEHTHTEKCYDGDKLVCGEEEHIFHQHTDDCYKNGALVCGKTELLRHQHDEKCIVSAETKKVLTCKLEEHQHDEILCYPEKTKKIFGEKISLKRERTYTAHICNENGVEIKDDDNVVTLSGKFPSGLAVRAIPVDIVVDGTEPICAYDIKIYDSDGKLYEVDERDPVKVEISLPSLKNNDALPTVCYVRDNGGTEIVASETNDETVSFETNHFSVYAVLAAKTNGVGTWAAMTNAVNNAANGEVIQLTADFNVGSNTIEIPSGKNVVLDLNGHTLTCGTGSAEIPFKIASGGALTLRDSTQQKETVSTVTDGNKYGRVAEISGNTLTYYVTETEVVDPEVGSTTETLVKHTVPMGGSIVTGSSGEAIFYVDGGTLNMESGFIRGGSERAVYMNGGTANLSGGYICGINRPDNNNDDSFGAAIWAEGGTLNITGTVLAGNVAGRGGAICAHNNAFVNINGGILSGNETTRSNTGGGGIFAYELSTVAMNGGYVTNNNVRGNDYNNCGGGMAIGNGSKLNIYNGYITGNTASGGAGIVCQRNGSIKMHGGFISGNAARAVEGGGMTIEAGGKLYIVSGHITNNNLIQTAHWGGGGIFVAEDAQAFILDALITENTAGGLGGGVAGCSTGRINITVKEGGAIYNNDALGEHFSGSSSSKSDDHKYAAEDDTFLSYGFKDYYCALSSRVHGQMLGGYPAYWSGTVDGYAVSDVTWDLTAESVMGLTAHPKEDGITAAKKLSKVYINGNFSYTHGGGILCNGYLLIGITDQWNLGSRLEISADKTYVSAGGHDKEMTEGQFKFEVVNEAGTVISEGKNLSDGTISFDKRIVHEEPGTFVYKIYEVKGDDNRISYDTTEYRMTVTVGESNMTPLNGLNEQGELYNILRKRRHITSIEIDARNGSGNWESVYQINPGDPESGPVRITIPRYNGDATFNNREINETNVKVVKKWSDDTAANSVTVELKRDGQKIDTKVLNAQNNWTYTWRNLPVDNGGNAIYKYTVEEIVPDGYSATYNTFNSFLAGKEYWVPASSFELGKKYIIVNKSGDRALYITYPHEDAGFDSTDQIAVTRQSGSLTLRGQTYSTWYNHDDIDPRSIFYLQTATKSGNTGLVMRCKGTTHATWLLVQEAHGNHFKGTSGITYSSFLTFSDGLLKGQENFNWNPNDLRTVIYANNKFNTVSGATSNAAELYELAYDEFENTKVIEITNTPVQDMSFTLNIKKVSAKDGNVYLAGAKFELLDSNNNPLHFTGGNGVYSYTDDTGAAVTVVTTAHGSIKISGLPAGTYTLHETEAPPGYSCVDKQVTLDESSPDASLSVEVRDPVYNYILPHTGGTGTFWFTAGGLILVIGSLLIGCVLRRKRGRRLTDCLR